MKRILKYLFLGFFSLGLWACAHKVSPDESARPLNYSAVRALVAKLSKNVVEIKNVRALYRTTISHSNSRSSFRYSLLCGPESMRLEMLPLNSAYALSVVVVKDGKALLLDTQEKSARFGSSPEELMKHSLGFPLGIEELCAHLFGRLSERDYKSISQEEALLSDLDGVVVTRLRNHKLNIAPEEGLLKAMEIYSEFNEKLELTAKFDAMKSFEQLQVPTQVYFSLGNVDATVSMQLVAFNASKPISPERFSLEVPAGYKILQRE